VEEAPVEEVEPAEEEAPAEEVKPDEPAVEEIKLEEPVMDKVKPEEPAAEEPPAEEEASQQVGSALLDHLKQETLKEQAALELEKVQANITIAKNEGWAVEHLEMAVEEMKKAMDEGNYSDAVDLGVAANQSAKPVDADHVDPEVVENTINRLQIFINKAPTILDTAEAKGLLEKARSALAAGDNSTALKHAKECKTNLKEKGDLVNTIKGNLKNATVHMNKNKMAGKDTTVTEELIRKAKAALKARDYNQALRHSADAQAKSEG
jgi:hypothetical protein